MVRFESLPGRLLGESSGAGSRSGADAHDLMCPRPQQAHGSVSRPVPECGARNLLALNIAPSIEPCQRMPGGSDAGDSRPWHFLMLGSRRRRERR